MLGKFLSTILFKKPEKEVGGETFTASASESGYKNGPEVNYCDAERQARLKKTLLLDVPDGVSDEVLERLSAAFEIVTAVEKGISVDYVLSEYRMPEQVDAGQMKDDMSAKGSMKAHDEEFLSRAREVVKHNIDNTDFSKAGFALEMCMSQSLLFKKIKSLTGMSLVDFVRTIRMDHAMELLGDTSLSISEIGERCGYASVSYFGEVFKKTYSKSPSEYRITPPIL